MNYALRQTGRLSSIHLNYSAELALDGDNNANFYNGSCMHTGISVLPPYWSVDLGKIITVTAVTLTSVNLLSHSERVSNFVIRIGMAEIAEDENYENCVGRILGFGSPETRTIFCINPIRGRFVTIVSGVEHVFHLCEVTVHGNDQGLCCSDWHYILLFAFFRVKTLKRKNMNITSPSVIITPDYGPIVHTTSLFLSS